MNKKLLLILSILMSLSLFTMSCSKSVTAPDTEASDVKLDIAKVWTAMVTYGNTITDGDVQIDLKLVETSLTSADTLTYTYNNTSAQSVVFNENSILNKIAESFQSITHYVNGVSSISVGNWTKQENIDINNLKTVTYYLTAQAIGKYGNKLDFTFILTASGNITWQ